MLEIRQAVSQDSPGVLKLVAEVYAEYDCVLDVENDEPNLPNAAEYFRASGGDLWVIEEGGLVKGVTGVFLSNDAGELKTLYLHGSLRGRGLGRKLVYLAVEHARRAGKGWMIIWSDTRFVDAHRLYLGIGFTKRGTRELNDVNDSVEYGFEKRLVP